MKAFFAALTILLSVSGQSQATPIAQLDPSLSGADRQTVLAGNLSVQGQPDLHSASVGDHLGYSEPVSISTVPLPSSISMLGVALLVLGGATFVARHRFFAATPDLGAAATGTSTGSLQDRATPPRTFRIEVSNHAGKHTYLARSPRQAIEMIADLLNDDFKLERLSDRNNITVDYDEIVRASYQYEPC